MISWNIRPAAAPLIIVLVGAACAGNVGSSSTAGETPGPDPAIHVQAMDAIGDSISKGLNADILACPNTDQETFNWATSDTHLAVHCSAGPEGVFSLAEQIECVINGDIVSANPNAAMSGAQMLTDFEFQAQDASAFLTGQTGPRLVTIFMGHNDVCGGTIDKVNAGGCAGGADQDPLNHCRTTPAAFEREFRRGLDTLIGVFDLRIGIAAIVRVSLLCNLQAKPQCSTFGFPAGPTCGTLWATAPGFLGPSGICGSLTADCSPERIVDAYIIAAQYREILARVTAEYAAIPVGGLSPVVIIGGQTVGGAPKSAGTTLVFTDAPWVFKFQEEQVSCCDCFHPTVAGQNVLAEVSFAGLQCNDPDVFCCQDTGDPLADALCDQADGRGTFFPGLF